MSETPLIVKRWVGIVPISPEMAAILPPELVRPLPCGCDPEAGYVCVEHR